MGIQLLLVTIGGALGSITRFAISMTAVRLLGTGFPWGTLLVNVIGCFSMGLVAQFLLGLDIHPPQHPVSKTQLDFWRYGIAIGFLGGLTTFSSFGADTMREFAGGRPIIALSNITANVLLSLAAVWCGMFVVRTAV